MVKGDSVTLIGFGQEETVPNGSSSKKLSLTMLVFGKNSDIVVICCWNWPLLLSSEAWTNNISGEAAFTSGPSSSWRGRGYSEPTKCLITKEEAGRNELLQFSVWSWCRSLPGRSGASPPPVPPRCSGGWAPSPDLLFHHCKVKIGLEAHLTTPEL